MKFQLLLILPIIIIACRPRQTETLRITHPEVLAALPLKIAAADFEKGKLALESYGDHALALAQFMRGDTDVLFIGTTLGATQAAKGVKLWRTPIWGTASILVRRGFSTQKSGELKLLAQKKIALPFAGSPNDVQLKRLAQKAGVAWRVIYQPHAQSVASLLAGQVDAIVVPEPIASKLVASGQAERFAVLADMEIKLFGDRALAPMVSFFIRDDLSPAKMAILTALEKKMREAVGTINMGNVNTDFWSKQYQLTPDVFLQGLKYTRFEFAESAVAIERSKMFLNNAGIRDISPDFFIP